jgi:hypothetical protein
MATTRFIFIINAERHYNILVRIITLFNKQRTPVTEFSSHLVHNDDKLTITIAFDENRENAVKLSRRLNKEIDIISINVFEQFHHDQVLLNHNSNL